MFFVPTLFVQKVCVVGPTVTGVHDLALFHDVACIHTDKKENQIFLIYKEIQNGAVAKS